MRSTILSHLVLAVLLCAASALAAGEVDTSFRASLVSVDMGHVYRSVVQPDGKIVIAGDFTSVGGAPRINVARLNADGTVDLTFNPPPIVGYSLQTQSIRAVVLQSDGKIVIGGSFATNTIFSKGIIRLNPDGSLDDAFSSSPYIDSYEVVHDLKIYPDDRIVVAGGRRNPQTFALAILNPDGSPNTEVPVRGTKLALQDDGKIIVFDNNVGMFRLNQNLAPDNSFALVTVGPINFNSINSIVIQPDGKIVACGPFTSVNGSTLVRVARFNSNGSVDTTFNIGLSGPNAEVESVEVLPGGKVLIGGAFTSVNGTPRSRIALLNSDGTVDPSFTATNGFTNVHDLDVLTDGKIIASGTSTGSSVSQTNIIKLDSTGTRANQFEGIVGYRGIVHKVKVLADGKIMVSGDFNCANGAIRQSMARFNADGTLDTSFSQTYFKYYVYNFDVIPDGKVVVSGFTPMGEPVTVRLNTDGTRDITFFPQSSSTSINVLPDGKVLLGYSFGFRRFNANGTLDATFTSVATDAPVVKAVVLEDGKILIGGSFARVNGTDRMRIARLNANGTLDLSFNSQIGPNNAVLDIELQAGGKILIAGHFTHVNFVARLGLARLNSDGSLDNDFLPVLNGAVYSIKPQTDGKLLIGGLFTSVNGVPRSFYARLHPNGTLDTSFFVGNGANGAVRDIDQQSDGKIIMVGEFSTVNGIVAPGIVRLLNAPSVTRTAYDYDGDGKADVSVFRPSENQWYILRSSDSVFTQYVFGTAGDMPVPADYDGDGKTDIAIFRPSSGVWWSIGSATGNAVSEQWGAAGDIPRPSDYDGDGRADYIVFRPSNNYWYRLSSFDRAQSNQSFGQQDDKPLVGDFDGDGKTDKAIFRPSTGEWWYQASSDNVYRVVQWGASTDRPAPGDFDGDGKTDFALFRPSTGIWYVLKSSNLSFAALQFGLAEDKPTPADYDGDGFADIAVFRPSSGIWYLMRSTAGFTGVQFGISTDIPTENALLP